MELKTFDNKPIKYKVFVAGRESYSVVSNRFVDDLIEAVLQMFSYETKKLQIFRMDRDGSKHIVYSQNAEKKAGGKFGKRVRDRYTNEVYISVNKAAKETGFTRFSIDKQLKSITTSQTRFIYE